MVIVQNLHLRCPSWIIVELYQTGLNCQERQPYEAPKCSKLFGTNYGCYFVNQTQETYVVTIF